MTLISIIIPTLNEADTILKTVDHTINAADKPESLELIVVDAGSRDHTPQIAMNLPVQLFMKPEFALKKYLSLNYGASKASGELLIFLDADTLLPNHFDRLILQKLKNPKVVGGAFAFSFQEPDFLLWLLSHINRLRYTLERIYYGDQAVWVRRDVFDQLEGFPPEQLMESAYFCRKLKRVGKLSLIKKPVKTSPRRFQKYGIFKVSFFDLNMIIRFNLGLPISEYARKYWGKNLAN